MNTRFCFCVAAFLLSSNLVRAVSENTLAPDVAVRDKVDWEERSISLETGLHREAVRRAEAEKKVKVLRNIPPEHVQDWINGKLSEEALEKLVVEARKNPSGGAKPIVPRARLGRFLLLSVVTVVLAFLYAAQRRRARVEATKKKPHGG